MSIRNTVVPAGDRAEFRDRARRTRSHYAERQCNYWLFEESQMPGAYVEFFEAKDRDTLLRAHSDAPVPVLESARLYVEVELN